MTLVKMNILKWMNDNPLSETTRNKCIYNLQFCKPNQAESLIEDKTRKNRLR